MTLHHRSRLCWRDSRDYLPRAILIVDLRDGYAGQWRDQYPYVRLHQPYRHFTAGDVPWALDKPRDYLAARDEVVAHLSAIAAKASEMAPSSCTVTSPTMRTPKAWRSLESITDEDNSPDAEYSGCLILAQGFAVENLRPHPWEAKQVVSLSVRDSAKSASARATAGHIHYRRWKDHNGLRASSDYIAQRKKCPFTCSPEALGLRFEGNHFPNRLAMVLRFFQALQRLVYLDATAGIMTSIRP